MAGPGRRAQCDATRELLKSQQAATSPCVGMADELQAVGGGGANTQQEHGGGGEVAAAAAAAAGYPYTCPGRQTAAAATATAATAGAEGATAEGSSPSPQTLIPSAAAEGYTMGNQSVAAQGSSPRRTLIPKAKSELDVIIAAAVRHGMEIVQEQVWPSI